MTLIQGNKPPNFLQKLYDFLAVDPNPCPEIIYWAADSKQLVIAQPERLAKEVLPKLFKHDKFASFGRQLNIYGFSRLFPGRQFKDAEGNVSDASVWAHPTLHRLSPASELASIKRRAPPKLIRTRRLANGEIIRTKAGPGVVEKAKKVKEAMSKGREKLLTTSTDSLSASSSFTVSVGLEANEASENTHVGRATNKTTPLVSSLESVMTPPPQFATIATSVNKTWLSPLSSSVTPTKDRPYVSCPASIHTSPAVPFKQPRLSSSKMMDIDSSNSTAASILPTALTLTSSSNPAPIITMGQGSLRPTLQINTQPNVSSTLNPISLGPPTTGQGASFPPAWIMQGKRSHTPLYQQAQARMSDQSQGQTHSQVQRIAAPAALPPTHLLPLPSFSSGIKQSAMSGSASITIENSAGDPPLPSLSESLILSTPPLAQAQYQYPYQHQAGLLHQPRLFAPPLDHLRKSAGLPAMPAGGTALSNHATLSSSFAVTPLCASTEQSIYVSADWDREGSWAQAQAKIAGYKAAHCFGGSIGIGIGDGRPGDIMEIDMELSVSLTHLNTGNAYPFPAIHAHDHTRVAGCTTGNGNGTIDPKWVSPAGSVWSTPSVTRVPSPSPAHVPCRAPVSSQTNAVDKQMTAFTITGVSEAPEATTTTGTSSLPPPPTPPPPFNFFTPTHLPLLDQDRLVASECQRRPAKEGSIAQTPPLLSPATFDQSPFLSSLGNGTGYASSPGPTTATTASESPSSSTPAFGCADQSIGSPNSWNPAHAAFPPVAYKSPSEAGLSDRGRRHSVEGGRKAFVHKSSPLVPLALPPTPNSARALSTEFTATQNSAMKIKFEVSERDVYPTPSGCGDEIEVDHPSGCPAPPYSAFVDGSKWYE